MNHRSPDPAADLPEVFFSDHGNVRYLHLDSEWVQGSMDRTKPYDIELEYVQRMMAWLLFVEPDCVPGRQAMQLGLGAGALTKFCHKRLRMRTTAVEINPGVLHACRGWFRLPSDDARLSVVIGDAATEIRRDEWIGGVDALQVDLYDHDAAAPVLDSAEFYADCRRLLTDEGTMTVNLFGRRASFAVSVDRIASVFGADAVWTFRPTREGNSVVLARRSPGDPGREVLAARAAEVEARWGLPARKWLRVFKPMNP